MTSAQVVAVRRSAITLLDDFLGRSAYVERLLDSGVSSSSLSSSSLSLSLPFLPSSGIFFTFPFHNIFGVLLPLFAVFLFLLVRVGLLLLGKVLLDGVGVNCSFVIVQPFLLHLGPEGLLRARLLGTYFRLLATVLDRIELLTALSERSSGVGG